MGALAAEMTGGPLSAGTSTRTAVPQLVFSEVYRQYFDFVWRSARGLGVHPPGTEDVVQEVFVVVHRQLPEFEGRSTLRTWLSRIVLNVVRHHRRSLARKSPHVFSGEDAHDPDALAAHGPDPYASALLSEGTRLVQRLLDTLDDDKREVLVLAEFEEFTVPEIADALSLKLNTAYSRLRLARHAFEEALARHRADQDGRRP